MFSAEERCGLYVFHFANGDTYIGQAIEVTRRYAQHRMVHDDIGRISFKRCTRAKLNEEERTLTWQLEAAGHRLRNVSFTSCQRVTAILTWSFRSKLTNDGLGTPRGATCPEAAS